MNRPERPKSAAANVEKSGVATRRNKLRREIAIAAAVKAAALFGLWIAFFSHPQLPKMTEGMAPDRVAAALVATPQPQPPRESRHDH